MASTTLPSEKQYLKDGKPDALPGTRPDYYYDNKNNAFNNDAIISGYSDQDLATAEKEDEKLDRIFKSNKVENEKWDVFDITSNRLKEDVSADILEIKKYAPIENKFFGYKRIEWQDPRFKEGLFTEDEFIKDSPLLQKEDRPELSGEFGRGKAYKLLEWENKDPLEDQIKSLNEPNYKNWGYTPDEKNKLTYFQDQKQELPMPKFEDEEKKEIVEDKEDPFENIIHKQVKATLKVGAYGLIAYVIYKQFLKPFAKIFYDEL